MSIYIADILPFLIFFQSIVFSIILITDNSPKKISNIYMAIFFTVIGLQFLAIISKSLKLNAHYLQSTLCVYGFMYGPLFYLYTKSLIHQSFKFRITQTYHFIPAFLIIVFTLFHFNICRFIGLIFYISLIIYLIYTIQSILAFREVIKDTQSSINLKDLMWLQWTIIIFCTTLLLDIVDQFILSMDLIFGISSIHLTLLFLINWMYYKGLRQPQIFLGISESDQQLSMNKENYFLESVPNSVEIKDLDKIKQFMINSNIYTKPDLNLNELALSLELSPRHLSYLINNFLNQNFVTFVNHYRIEKAKYRLKNPKEKGETISEIMYEVGFNSKSSFNTLFKQYTGYTPSEFRNLP